MDDSIVTRSIRARLFWGTAAGMALLWVAASLVVYGLIRDALLKELDTSLAAMARSLAVLVEYDDGETEFDFDPATVPEFQGRGAEKWYYQVWTDEEEVLDRSPALRNGGLEPFHGALDEPVFRFLVSPVRMRAVGLKTLPKTEEKDDVGDDGSASRAPAPPVVFVLARDTAALDSRLRFLQIVLTAVSLGAVALTLILGRVVIGRGLRPLDSLARQVSSVGADSLGTRFDAGAMPSELLPVVHRLNDLLSRLKSAFDRERGFSRDVAHELRTPLAGMRSTLEVALSRDRPADEYKESLSDCLEVCVNLESVVSRLLTLTRLETGQETLRPEAVLIAGVVDSCWQPFAEKARQKRLEFKSAIPDDLTCMADRELLRIVISNLLENAAGYTNGNGSISVTGAGEGQSVQIHVSNTGCRLSGEDAGRVFDRFWRGDPSRSETGVHCGLGLSLVKQAIVAMGGTAEARVKPGGVFDVCLELRQAGGIDLFR